MKYATVVGINKYSNPYVSALEYCVPEARAFADVLSERGFEVNLLLNEQATEEAASTALKNMILKSAEENTKNVLVYHCGHHGSNTADKDGDETDGKDETFVMYDYYGYRGVWKDDEVREILDLVDPKDLLIFIADTCHSGTSTRAMFPADRKARYFPPENPVIAPTRNQIAFPEEGMNHLLLSGCKALEVGYDGVFTSALISALEKGGTWREVIKRVNRSILYPQHPQLEGPEELKDLNVFEPIPESVPKHNPSTIRGFMNHLLELLKWARQE